MKRTYAIHILLLAVLFVAAYNLNPYPGPGIHGGYSDLSRLAFCDNHVACIHEIGHRLDQAGGYPSQGVPFGVALNIHLAVAFHNDAPDALSMQMLRELTGHNDDFRVKQELYANLFQMAEGKAENMPADLRPFYDWQLAGRLEARLRDGQVLYWLGG